MSNLFKVATISLGLALLSHSAIACACEGHKAERKFYIGAEGGWSASLKDSFTHKETKVRGSLKPSPLYGVIVGYRFYPAIAVEANWQHKPRYVMNFTLPEKDLGQGMKVSKTDGKAKIISNIYMLGITYDLPAFGKIVPYVGIDGGIAQIKTKYMPLKRDINVPGVGIMNQEVFRIKSKSNISPAAQFTVGLSSEITPHLRLNLAGRIQVIKDAKISYEELNSTTKVFDSKKLKQTIGVSEIVLGLTFDLPI